MCLTDEAFLSPVWLGQMNREQKDIYNDQLENLSFKILNALCCSATLIVTFTAVGIVG